MNNNEVGLADGQFSRAFLMLNRLVERRGGIPLSLIVVAQLDKLIGVVICERIIWGWGLPLNSCWSEFNFNPSWASKAFESSKWKLPTDLRVAYLSSFSSEGSHASKWSAIIFNDIIRDARIPNKFTLNWLCSFIKRFSCFFLLTALEESIRLHLPVINLNLNCASRNNFEASLWLYAQTISI